MIELESDDRPSLTTLTFDCCRDFESSENTVVTNVQPALLKTSLKGETHPGQYLPFILNRWSLWGPIFWHVSCYVLVQRTICNCAWDCLCFFVSIAHSVLEDFVLQVCIEGSILCFCFLLFCVFISVWLQLRAARSKLFVRIKFTASGVVRHLEPPAYYHRYRTILYKVCVL